MPLTHKLRRPFQLNGKTLTELNIDFDEIDADRLISAYDEHAARRATNPGYGDQMLPLLLIAKMNGIVVEDLRSHLKGRDYLILIRKVESFFESLDSPIAESPPLE